MHTTAPLPVSAIVQHDQRETGPTGWQQLTRLLRAHLVLFVGLAALIVPTIIRLADEVWATEEGAHGPIVLASGLWLLWNKWPDVRAEARPGRFAVAVAATLGAMLVYLFGRVVGVIGIEMGGLALGVLSILYAHVGARALKNAWFPLLYLCFVIPLPDTIVTLITQPLKLGISQSATALLQLAGYPVANTGVVLQVAQYELLVAAACSGLNALITLTALGLFYAYVLHRASWRYCLLLMLAAVPAAIFANFVRVVALILVTYHLGDAAGQGFLHDMAGLTTFVVALLFLFALDSFLAPLRRRLDDRPRSEA
jgi:exosortase B